MKKSDPGARGVGIGPGPHGGIETSNTSLTTLLTFAYGVHEYQILDAPGWAKDEPFDVTLTPDRSETRISPSEAHGKNIDTMVDRQRQRMQAVLRDRFGLKLRIETRELPIYALLPAKTGIELKAADAAGGGPRIGMNAERSELTAVGASMRMLTDALSNVLGRPVLDETEFEGTFDMTLNWRPETFLPGPGEPLQRESQAGGVDGVPIFNAVTEQLGLRLESKKGQAAVYVIEKVQHPTEN